jgi:hypothetical protein
MGLVDIDVEVGNYLGQHRPSGCLDFDYFGSRHSWPLHSMVEALEGQQQEHIGMGEEQTRQLACGPSVSAVAQIAVEFLRSQLGTWPLEVRLGGCLH